MLWMKVRDLLQLPLGDDQRKGQPDLHLHEIRQSILTNGWHDDSTILICDGKIHAGFRRVRALRELFSASQIDSKFMVGVKVLRMMWVQRLIDVELKDGG
jgi:hypothetical protein